MAKQLNVDLTVKADTKQAQEALNALGKSLHDIQNIRNMPMVADESYRSAANAAKELERNLQSAVNVDTGKLDLNKFSMSLQKSNTSITELAVKLNGAGATGQQAFLNLAKSIALADNSALNLGTKLGGLMTTLKNTARWQISSSILHGFMGAIQGAYGYAQDLNESLNNIRIVTGQSIDQMAKFADEANKAARALSTTTTEYTNASLIYYQQGLSDEEVKARTDVTIKLANVSRQSAEEVSSQMTAVWNNFADGSKSLEYYADVITALGASTASSSSEIAEGLQKFASIADTVGLSYEKASAALATVVAETRQSADVVGTAFKTMFARFQGLSLGETLEDGVDLNKYSKALKTVGVNILDANGQLKEMDTILDETYARWNQISEAQKVALAETVAGTRQYAQFMAIMNNYDKILTNQSLAESSEGTVQEQADIYAESWEAARDRVRAALEEVYGQLLDDKFFIGLLNFAEKAVSVISNVIEGLGGIKGLVMLIGTIFMNTYAKEMPRVLETISQNLLIISGRGEQVKSNMLAEVQAGLDLNRSSGMAIGQQTMSKEMSAQYEATQKAVEMTRKLNAAMKTLSQTEIEEYQAKIQQVVKDGEYLATLGKEIDLLEKKNAELAKATAGSAKASFTGASKETWGQLEKQGLTEQSFSTSTTMGDAIIAAENEQIRAQDIYVETLARIEQLKSEEIQDDEAIAQAEKDKEAALQIQEQAALRLKALKETQAGLEKKINDSFKTTAGSATALNSEVENIKLRTDKWKQAQESIGKLLSGTATQQEKGKKLTGELAEQMQKYGEYIKTAAEDAQKVAPEGQKKVFEELVSEATEFQQVVAKAAETGDWSEVTTMLEKDGTLFDHLSAAAGTAAENLKTAKAELRVHEGMDPEKVDELATSLGNADAKQRVFNQGLKDLGASAEQSLNHTTALSEGLTMIGSSAMQVSMAINGIKRIGDIWNNDDLSAGEKLLQTMTSLSMVLPVITTLTNAQKLADMSSAAARALGITSIFSETKAHWLSVPAKNAAGAAGYVALGPLLLFVGIAAGAIALIYGIVKGIKALIDAYNADAIAAEKAAKTAQELADAAKEAKDRLDDIKTAVDQYKSVVDKLNSCTRGTQEWRDALEEVHAQINTILEKYPELLKEADLFNKDGTLNTDVLDRFQAQAQTAATTANAAALQGAAVAAQARTKANTTDASRKYEVYSEYGAYNLGHKDNTFATVQSDLDKLLDTYQLNGSQALELQDVYAALGDVTDDYAKSLKALAENSISATNMMNNAAQATIDQWARDTGKNLIDGQSLLMTDAYNTAYKTFSDAIKKASDSNAKSDNKDSSKLGTAFDNTTFAGMSVTEAFNAARGTNYSLARNGVRGTDNNRTYAYLENGEEKEYTIAEMQATIAAAAALEQMGDAADKAREALSQMDDTTREFIGSGSLEGLSKGEFEDYKASLGIEEGHEVTADEAKQLLIDQGLSEAVAEQLKQSFANNLNIDWTSLTDDLDNLGIAEILGEKITDGLSLGNAEGLVTTVKALNLGPIVGEQGESAGQIFVQKLNNELLSGLSKEDQESALNELVNIDWSKWDAIEQVDAIMKEFGVDIDTSSAEWQDFANQMRIAAGAQPDFSRLKDDLSNVSTILGSLDFGKTIKDEDYQKLVAYNNEWERFFLLQADGTRQFIGNADDMREEMLKNLAAQREDLQNRAAAQEALENQKWGFGEGVDREAIDWTDVKSSSKNNKISTLTNMMNDSGGMEDVLSILGYSDETLQKYLNDTDLYADEIDEVFNRIAEFMSQDYAAQDNDLSEKFASTATSYQQLEELLERGLTTEEAAARQKEYLADSAIKAATSLDELDVAIVKAQEAGVTVDYDKYANQLVNLAAQYDNTSFEVERYKDALERAKTEGGEQAEAALEEAEANLRAATAAGEAAKKYGLTAGQIERYAEELKNSGKYEKASKRELVELAKDQLRYDKAVVSAQKNMSKWTKDLKVAKETGHLVAETADEMAEAYGDLLDIDGSELSAEFLSNADNLELMEKALNGDEEAYRALQDAVRADIEARFGINDEEFQTKYADLFAKIDDIRNNGDIKVGASIDDQDFLDSLSEMVNAAGMTAQEATDYLSSMGIDAEVVNEPEQVEETVGYNLTPIVTPKTGSYTPAAGADGATYSYPQVRYETTPVTETKTVSGTALKVTSAAKSSGGSVKHKGSTSANGGSNGGKGGGGGGGNKDNRSAAKEHKQPTEESERYHVLNEQLDDLSAAYDKASKAKDRLFGANKLKAIDNEMKAIDRLIKHNQTYLKTIADYREKDKEKLLNGGLTKDWADSAGNLQTFTSSGLGIDLNFDENGVLLNYDEYVETAVNAYNAAVDAYNNVVRAEGVTEEQVKAAEDTFKQAEMQYELAMEALTQYEETVNLWEEKLEEIRDSFRELQDKRFEEWSYKLELKIKITDEDKRYLEYTRKYMERFAKSTWAPVTELFTIWNDFGSDSDWKVLQHSAGDLKDAFNSLKEATHGDPIIDSATGAILQDFDYSQADWMDALDDVQDKIYAQIDALLELDETMSNYYSETLSKGEEKLDQYMTKLEDCTNVLKHFQTVSELLGKETDYRWMGEILTAQRDTIQNELEAASTEYEYAKAQYETMLERYERDKNRVDEGTRELMEQELQAQYESMTKWQEAMLTKTEEFAEACIAVYENMVHQQGKILEDALTNGQGWDSMLASMDRVSAYQELILTRTNQLYETNKLMRKLSQDIDKTDSVAAKTKLANFRREIEDMQNMNEMSKFDLDVANARYELLKAQIALEEAQNAKSIVRLQRDSEGNYGYVYTADQDKIDNAQQALEDKQNDLYNLTLNKANENARALAELDKEMYDELERIAIEYRGNEEKIWEESLRVREEYAQRRAILERDYTEADYWQHQVSATKTNEAWADSYKKQLVNTDQWQAETTKFIGAVRTAHDELTANMEEYVAPVVGDNLYELKRKTDELKKSSEEYQKWFDNFANTNAERLDAIAETTNKYWLQREAVDALVDSLRTMADEINNIRAAESGMSRSINGKVEYDPTVDYSDLMQKYLAAGGSQSDTEYQQLKAAREAKIEGMNMSAAQYGARGSDFDNVLNYYNANGLTGYITPAVQAYAAENGDDWNSIIKGTTESQKELKEELERDTEKLKEIMEQAHLKTTETTEKVTTKADEFIATAQKNAETNAQKEAEARQEFSDVRKQQLDEANAKMNTDLDEANAKFENSINVLNQHLDGVRDAMREAAREIVTAMSNLHVDVSVSISGAMPTFDTGGYTGAWGSSGKLAMLHEKELVLNAEDTLNMLTAIDMVRQLNSAIDLRAASSGFATSLSSPGYQGIDQTLEQTVTITAEFPNATNHSEIEEAFDTLINRATQYASRPRNTSYGINSANV